MAEGAVLGLRRIFCAVDRLGNRLTVYRLKVQSGMTSPFEYSSGFMVQCRHPPPGRGPS